MGGWKPAGESSIARGLPSPPVFPSEPGSGALGRKRIFKHPRLGGQAEELGAGRGSRAKQDVRSLAGAQMPGPEEGEP